MVAEFDFQARHNARSEGQTEMQKNQNELKIQLNVSAHKLANAIKEYADGKYAIKVLVDGNEVVITKKMEGFFLKINNVMTISVDSEGTFAVKRGDYDEVIGANGKAGSLTETEMMDAVADWLPE